MHEILLSETTPTTCISTDNPENPSAKPRSGNFAVYGMLEKIIVSLAFPISKKADNTEQMYSFLIKAFKTPSTTEKKIINDEMLIAV